MFPDGRLYLFSWLGTVGQIFVSFPQQMYKFSPTGGLALPDKGAVPPPPPSPPLASPLEVTQNMYNQFTTENSYHRDCVAKSVSVSFNSANLPQRFLYFAYFL